MAAEAFGARRPVLSCQRNRPGTEARCRQRKAARRVAGRIAEASGQDFVARAHFDQALNLAESLDRATDMSRVAFDYAHVLEVLGDSSQAFIRYRQAYLAREAAVRSQTAVACLVSCSVAQVPVGSCRQAGTGPNA